MKRREFIAGLGGAAAWPLSARAQQGGRVRRIGVLTPLDENDPLAKTLVSAFTQAVAGLGWTDGRNMRLDIRWVGDDINRIRTPGSLRGFICVGLLTPCPWPGSHNGIVGRRRTQWAQRSRLRCRTCCRPRAMLAREFPYSGK